MKSPALRAKVKTAKWLPKAKAAISRTLNSRKASASSNSIAMAAAAAAVDAATGIVRTRAKAANHARRVKVVSAKAAKPAKSASRVNLAKTVANVSRVKRVTIVANASRAKIVANSAANRASVVRHASHVTKTPVQKGFRTDLSPRFCAAATNA